MRRTLALLVTASALSGAVLLGAARAGDAQPRQLVAEDLFGYITVSNVRIQARAGTADNPGNVHLDGEVMNYTAEALAEVVLRVSLTAPDSDEVQVDRRVHVLYNPALTGE